MLQSLVLARLQEARAARAEYAEFEDSMAEFEDELIDAEETFNTLKVGHVHPPITRTVYTLVLVSLSSCPL